MNISMMSLNSYNSFTANRKVVKQDNPNSDYIKENVYEDDRKIKSIYSSANDSFVVNFDERGRVLTDPIISNYKDSGFVPNPAAFYNYAEDD